MWRSSNTNLILTRTVRSSYYSVTGQATDTWDAASQLPSSAACSGYDSLSHDELISCPWRCCQAPNTSHRFCCSWSDQTDLKLVSESGLHHCKIAPVHLGHQWCEWTPHSCLIVHLTAVAMHAVRARQRQPIKHLASRADSSMHRCNDALRHEISDFDRCQHRQ